MKKTFKKSDIKKYINSNRVDELTNKNGTLINATDNYVQNRNYVKSKKTTDDYIRNTMQGPEAYFIYGGPYHGINYSYVVSEEDDMFDDDIFDLDYNDEIYGNEDNDIIDLDYNYEVYDELNVVPVKHYSRHPEDVKRREAKKSAEKDITKHFNKPSEPFYDDLPVEKWRGHKLPYDTEFDIDLTESEDSLKRMIDEILMKNKKSSSDFVKRTNEQDVIGDDIIIPDVSELKTIHQKPMVIRKINSLLDLINKENLKGDELSILLNHIINNVDIYSMDEKHRELLGDKLKYGEEEGK